MAYEYDLSEYEKKGQKYKEQAQKNAEIAASNIQKSYEPSINQIQQEQKGLTAQYDQQRATNDWNTRVAARNFMEQMANIGNADSGLNRSGQARIQAANIQNAGAINLAQQSASNDLTTALNKIIAERDLNIANTRQEYLERGQEQYDNYMAAMEQAEIDAAAQRYAADKEFETQKAEREFEWAKLQQQHEWEMQETKYKHELEMENIIAKATTAGTEFGDLVKAELDDAKVLGNSIRSQLTSMRNSSSSNDATAITAFENQFINDTIDRYYTWGFYTDDSGKLKMGVAPREKTMLSNDKSLSDLAFQTAINNAGLQLPSDDEISSYLANKYIKTDANGVRGVTNISSEDYYRALNEHNNTIKK